MSFPSSIDSFTSPTSNQNLNAPSHSAIETAQNTALSAIETKLGADSSAVTTSIDYLLKSASSVSPGHKHVKADITDGGSYISTGFILPYAGSSAPTGFLLCDGSAVSRTTYAALFAITSTSYGIGDGATTFNVPDLRSRAVIGVGTGTKVYTFASRSSDTITATGMANSATNENITGNAVVYVSTGSVITGLTSSTTYYLIRQTATSFKLASSLANAVAGTAISLSSDGSGTQTFTFTLSARALGDTGGEENHSQLAAEIAAHTHTVGQQTAYAGGANNGANAQSSAATQAVSGSTGSNTAMNNMQPFLSVNYVIKT
jgi:microcystin-dependent protein